MARPSNLPAIWLTLTLAVPTLGAAGDFAFVTNQNSEDLSILDIDAGTELARIPVAGKPAGVVAVGGSVFTVSPDSKTVRRLDRTGTVLTEMQLDGGPIGIAHDARRCTLYVSDWYNARVWRLDADTMRVTGTLATGSAPAGLDVSPDGRWLASADRDADAVSLFDLGTGNAVQQIAVGERPFGLRFAPDGRLFVANVGTNDVTVLDPSSGKRLALIPVGERPYGIAFAQGRGFVTNQYADSVSVFDMGEYSVLETIEVGEYPEGIDTTSDGTRLLVANWFSNSVSVIDAATLAITAKIETGDGPRAFGRFIAPSKESSPCVPSP